MGEIRLTWWREVLDEAFEGPSGPSPSRPPRPWPEAIGRHGLPRDRLEDDDRRPLPRTRSPSPMNLARRHGLGSSDTGGACSLPGRPRARSQGRHLGKAEAGGNRLGYRPADGNCRPGPGEMTPRPRSPPPSNGSKGLSVEAFPGHRPRHPGPAERASRPPAFRSGRPGPRAVGGDARPDLAPIRPPGQGGALDPGVQIGQGALAHRALLVAGLFLGPQTACRPRRA